MRGVLAVALIASVAGVAHAADQASAEAALAAAQQAETEAARSDNRWVPTEAALKAARQAIAAGQYDAATTQADLARALAERSVEQSTEQEKLWRDAVVR